MSVSEKAPQSVVLPSPQPLSPLTKFIRSNRRPISALLFFVVLIACFTAANPRLFTNPQIYNAVFVSLPISIILVVPLVFIVVELATLMVGTNAAEGLLMEQVERLIGEQGAQAIHHLLDSWQKNGVGGVAAVVEVATLLFALIGAFDQLQDALNWIWGVEPKRQGSLLSRFRRRFLSSLGVLGTAFLLLVSLVTAAGGQALTSHLPGSGLLTQSLVSVISFTAVTLVFGMIFKLLPQAKVAWADVWIGATVTAALFSAGKWLIVLYLGKTIIVSLYGNAAPL